jgi:hypothetical protein
MTIVPTHPPKRSCGLESGARVVVTSDFKIWETRFTKGETLVFKRELWDRDTGYDIYVFGTPESVVREQALPEIRSIDDHMRWIELCPERIIYGDFEHEQPASWLQHFRRVD